MLRGLSAALLLFAQASSLGAAAGSAAGGLLFDVAPLPHASFLPVTALTILGVLLSLGLPKALLTRRRGEATGDEELEKADSR
jgi:hypothetical protein